MNSYAQTNVQLFNQLRSAGYSGEELTAVMQAYEFAIRIFAGLYLPSGKPFIDHLVGTASILASLRMSAEVVVAGLIHAAYLHGDFGTLRSGISQNKRKLVQHTVGKTAEEYVERYDRLLFSAETIATLSDSLDSLDVAERNVLVMHLANELEHHLDLGALYFPEEKQQQGHRRYMEDYGPKLVKMAERLRFISLAADMAEVFSNIATSPIPLEPCVRANRRTAYLIVACSYRQYLALTLLYKASEAYGLLLIHWSRAQRLCGRVWKSLRIFLQADSRIR